ncbi:hypothetical protein NW762_013165 [Fusarium torreyae]|uniref:Fungal N-terminal domain-containing protein n=1 Tax=Fusarium torreyae TaxID=1237075 RepID=A0A9W8RL73_9HYPO|nr:hypothetical protein NW762_013165 [Fusarium torreyae]
MSDPLSVAGTAVGIVSLGIHVCKSLVSYLQSLEGRNQEIKAGLAEVEAVVSIFYSLNGILPKIDESSIDATTIRRCLRDSEVKLVDLQQFLIKLRGPQHAMPSTIAKIDEAGRSLIHPLRAGKLTSLRQSLQELLSNLNIAVNLVTLESASVIHDDVDKLQMSVSDLGAQICHHSDQLQSLKDTVNDSLKDFKQRASQIELRQMESNEIINAKLTLMGSAIGSIATSNQRLGEAFAELLEKGEFRSGSSISRTVSSIPFRAHRLN